MGVVPKHPWKYGKDVESSWSKPRLGDFTDKSWDELSDKEKRSIAGHFAWAKDMPPENFSDLKLPHHDPKTHNVVWNGVRAAMAALLGARGGVDIPADDRKKVYNHLVQHYKEFGKEPPQFHEAFDSDDIIEVDDKVFKQEETENISVQYEVYGSKYALTKKGAVLKVSGVLMYPGTFTPMNGDPTSFSEEELKRLVTNTKPPVKLFLTHFDREHIGYCTKIWYNEKDRTIEWNGYVFEKYDPIMTEGFFKTSPEIDPESYSIVGIAFVPNPAIPESMVKKLEVIAMSAPENVSVNVNGDESTTAATTINVTTTDTETAYGTTTTVPSNVVDFSNEDTTDSTNVDVNIKIEFSDAENKEEEKTEEVVEEVDVEKLSFSEYLGHKGLSEEDIQIAVEKAKSELVPSWFSDITEDEYKEFVEWRESRLENLVNEVKQLGFSKPEEILKFAKSHKEKIEILMKIKENLAFSEEVVDTSVEISPEEVNSEVDKIKEMCDRFGIDFELIKDKFVR